MQCLTIGIPGCWMIIGLEKNIYSKYNMNYTSGAASQLIIKSIWALRKTQNEDLKKMVGKKRF
jgi:hypothetical protein